MPIYEYRCASCGHELEALQRLADAPLTECPACHKTELKKLLSAAGFQLKGSGWYATDFRNSGAKPPAKEKPASGDAAAGDSYGRSLLNRVLTEAAAGGNGKGTGSPTAPEASSGDAGKAESKGAETKAAASPPKESRPAATTTPGGKSEA